MKQVVNLSFLLINPRHRYQVAVLILLAASFIDIETGRKPVLFGQYAQIDYSQIKVGAMSQVNRNTNTYDVMSQVNWKTNNYDVGSFTKNWICKFIVSYWSGLNLMAPILNNKQ